MSGVFGLSPTFQSQLPQDSILGIPVLGGQPSQAQQQFGFTQTPLDSQLGPSAGRRPFANPFSPLVLGTSATDSPLSIFNAIPNQGQISATDIFNQIQGLNRGELVNAARNLPGISAAFTQSSENLARAFGTPDFLSRGRGFLNAPQTRNGQNLNPFESSQNVLGRGFNLLVDRLNEQFLL